jgi:hypothetical protein
MATRRKLVAFRESDPEHPGLMATGCSGEWEIGIDGSLEEPRSWVLQIDGPTCYCSFEV